MSSADDKRLVLQRIEARRELFRLELDAVGRSVRPLVTAYGWGRRLVPLWTAIEPAARALRGGARGGRWTWLRYAPLLLLLVPLLRREPARAGDDSAATAEDG